MKLTLTAAFVSLAILANWLASRFTITVPFTDLIAPAGVLTIGAAFVLRDWLAQIAGFWWGVAVIPIAGGASYLIGEVAGWSGLQKIAIASVIAFCASEGLEAIVFAPLRRRNLTIGVLASGMAGNALDSWLFLTLAFGSTAFFWGNFIGKAEMILVGGLLTAARRYALPVKP
jgi:queuosine precursor transporter